MITPEQIQQEWTTFQNNITSYISPPRKEALQHFYNEIEEVAMFAPASANDYFHSCYPGGYIVHVNNVVRVALDMDQLWRLHGGIVNHTTEELVFAAINHDLGKLGISKDEPYYIPNESEWHIKNQGKIYIYNDKIPHMPVPDRSLFLLQREGIEVSLNEMLAIKLHDGLYDEGNKSYLVTFSAPSKPKTYLIHLLHQADMMASRIEFEQWYFNKEKQSIKPITKTFQTKQEIKEGVINKTLNKQGSKFQEILNNL